MHPTVRHLHLGRKSWVEMRVQDLADGVHIPAASTYYITYYIAQLHQCAQHLPYLYGFI